MEQKKVKCDVCGYEWSTTYNCIQQGTGCPKCGGTLKLTYEEVKAFIETKGITLLSNEYENANAHLDLKCDVCGFEWQAVYGSIQQDHGCPKCAIKRRSEKRITDIEEACKKVGFRVM